MGILLTFDIAESSEKTRDLAGALDRLGYNWFFDFQGSQIQLPETSVYHEARTPEQAINDFTSICLDFSIVNKCVFATELLNPAFAL